MTALEIALLAARLLGVSAALLLAPGLLLLAVAARAAEWPERVALAFCAELLLDLRPVDRRAAARMERRCRGAADRACCSLALGVARDPARAVDAAPAPSLERL